MSEVTGANCQCQGHMDYLENTYADLATIIKSRLRRTGATVEVQEAWRSQPEGEGEGGIQLSVLQ